MQREDLIKLCVNLLCSAVKRWIFVWPLHLLNHLFQSSTHTNTLWKLSHTTVIHSTMAKKDGFPKRKIKQLLNWTGRIDKHPLTDLKEWWAKADYLNWSREVWKTHSQDANYPNCDGTLQDSRAYSKPILSTNMTCHLHVLTGENI